MHALHFASCYAAHRAFDIQLLFIVKPLPSLPLECVPNSSVPWANITFLHAEIRRARLQFKKGTISAEQYEKEINEYISYSIQEQEKLGVDVLVHGEPERTDM